MSDIKRVLLLDDDNHEYCVVCEDDRYFFNMVDFMSEAMNIRAWWLSENPDEKYTGVFTLKGGGSIELPLCGNTQLLDYIEEQFNK